MQIGKNYENTFGLLGDARSVMQQLEAAIAAKKRTAWRKTVADFLHDTLQKQQSIINADAERIPTAMLCAELNATIPDNAIVVADTGWSAVWASTMLR